jgi:hypothetical protein
MRCLRNEAPGSNVCPQRVSKLVLNTYHEVDVIRHPDHICRFT